jgi:hypothetical protein
MTMVRNEREIASVAVAGEMKWLVCRSFAKTHTEKSLVNTAGMFGSAQRELIEFNNKDGGLAQ